MFTWIVSIGLLILKIIILKKNLLIN